MTKHQQLLAMLLVKKLVMCIELVHGMLGIEFILCGCDELLSFEGTSAALAASINAMHCS